MKLKLKEQIEQAIQLSENNISPLNKLDFIFPNNEKRLHFLNEWPGMSSPKGRHLFNNICRLIGEIHKVKYLEIGSWAGSSLLSFIYNQPNLQYASAADNFTQFQTDFDVRKMLELGLTSLYGEQVDITASSGTWWEKNAKEYEINYTTSDYKFQFLESHCFELDKNRLFGKYNVYFYDGPHAYQDTKNGFIYYNDVLEDKFIVIIDDWNRDYIQSAWRDVSKELNYTIHYEKELLGGGGAKTNPDWRNDWWDGYYIAIVEKG